MPASPPETTIPELIETYEALLIDAYGVLVHSSGAYPGAKACIEHLNERGVPYFVVTNDASRTSETAAQTYRNAGLAIESDRVLTSGEMVGPHFERHGLEGASCVVLGTDDSHVCVREAGGEIVDVHEDDFEVLVLADDAGYPFRETLNAVVTRLIRIFERGESVELLLPNPDLFYQRGLDAWGFASGSVARLLESILVERFPERRPRFEVLGKPEPLIFEEARRRAGTERMAMIGDQLATDVAGADRAGLDSVLAVGEEVDLESHLSAAEAHPDYLLHSLSLDR
jgi:4-nitrophenyl phosphatase